MLQHSFARSRFLEKEWTPLKLGPQASGDLGEVDNPSPAGHFSEYGQQIESIGVVAQDVFASLGVFLSVSTYLGDADFA